MENNKAKLKAWQIFFIIIGIMTTAFLIMMFFIIMAIIIIKPWGIDVVKTGTIIANPPTESSEYDHPLLSPAQEEILKTLGIDPKDVPTQLTPEQQKCAVNALGQDRALELINGAIPTTADLLKAKDCLQ